MVMAMGVFASAADGDATGTGTITINVPAGTTTATSYKVYKVFDASGDGTHISYKLRNGKETAPKGFTVDTAGNVSYTGKGKDGKLTADDIAAVADYVKDDTDYKTVTAEAGAKQVVVNDLDDGYYYITTTTGSIVTIDSTNPNAEVNDKNSVSTVKKSAGTRYDKDSMAAIDAVGTSQPFTAVITKGKGATKMTFTDTMTNMTYNGDVVVKVDGNEVKAGEKTYSVTGAMGDSVFTVTFVDSYIKGLGDAAKDITLNYSATITSDALTTVPAKNEATIRTDNNNLSSSEEVKVYNATVKVAKKDGKNTKAEDDDKPLEGAKFALKNEEGKYYKLADDGKSISWVDSVDDATIRTSDTKGNLDADFVGLDNGTYYLEETEAPAGYNKSANIEVTISDGDYTTQNLEQTKTVVNNQGAALPTTGGIGTTIFYVVGGILVAGAAVLLITRRRVDR